MGLLEQMKQLRQNYYKYRDIIKNEEQTKNALIMPFFQALGWDIHNPIEFQAEYAGDRDVKKGERVDYAIRVNNDPVILIEAKALHESLERHQEQLLRYFYAVSDSHIAILTNGQQYQFYSDLNKVNVMDDSPFFCFDIESFDEQDIQSLARFSKDHFDAGKIRREEEKRRYLNKAREFILAEFSSPSDELLALFSDSLGQTKINSREKRDYLKEAFASLVPISSVEEKEDEAEELASSFASSVLTMKNSKDYTGTKPVRFAFLGQVMEVGSWRELLVTVLNELISQHRFDELIKNQKLYESLCPDKKVKKPTALREPIELNNGMKIEVNLSTISILSRLKCICELENEDLYFDVIRK